MKKWSCLFTGLILVCSVHAGILDVPSVYPTIQSAINAAEDTDTVIVSPGIYNENINMSGKAITLTSTDPGDPNVVAATVIDGGNSDSVINCSSGEGTDTLIVGFTIQNGEAAAYGGGVYCGSSSPTIQNCVFLDNISGYFGGGIMCSGSNANISGCIFINNFADRQQGGGISCHASNPTIMNCLFSGNASDLGGGLSCYSSSPTVYNCTFAQNTANSGGGLSCTSSSSPTLVNCILWNNSATVGQETYRSGNSEPAFYYSDVKGSGGSTTWVSSYGIDGGDNLDLDPLFVDADGIDNTIGTLDDDLHLDPYSPCINVGDPDADYTGQTDIDFGPRVLYCRVDIGADEVLYISWDLVPDGQIDVADLVQFADGWLTEYDLSDFTALAEIWMCGVE